MYYSGMCYMKINISFCARAFKITTSVQTNRNKQIRSWIILDTICHPFKFHFFYHNACLLNSRFMFFMTKVWEKNFMNVLQKIESPTRNLSKHFMEISFNELTAVLNMSRTFGELCFHMSFMFTVSLCFHLFLWENGQCIKFSREGRK